jgi:hypothetical protein
MHPLVFYPVLSLKYLLFLISQLPFSGDWSGWQQGMRSVETMRTLPDPGLILAHRQLTIFLLESCHILRRSHAGEGCLVYDLLPPIRMG